MATINQQKILSVASLGAGATTTFTWNNYPQQTTLSYCAIPVPPSAQGPHGTSTGQVQITRVEITYVRDNYNGDKRHVEVDVKNTGSHATGVDLWESWIS